MNCTLRWRIDRIGLANRIGEWDRMRELNPYKTRGNIADLIVVGGQRVRLASSGLR